MDGVRPALSALLLLLALPLAAVAQIELMSSPVSHGRVAFTWTRNGNADIAVLDLATAQVKIVAPSRALDEYPAFSPDGSRVAFYSDRTGDREIFVAALDGDELVQLTRSPGPDEDPDWGADGRIAFHSARSGRGANIFVMQEDGSAVLQLTRSKRRNTVPRWMPGGGAIVFSTDAHWPGWDIERVDVGTGKVTALTDGWLTNCRARPSPDGTQLVYSRGAGKEVDLWLMRSDGSDPRRITHRTGKEYDGAWLDSKTILFVGELDRGKENYQLFSLDLSSGTVSQMTAGAGSIRYLSIFIGASGR